MLKTNKIYSQRAMNIHRSGPVFWGWYVVFSSFVMLTVIYGARYSFGVFVKPMFAEYNWPMTVISLAASINLLMYASGGVFAGWLLDRVAPNGSPPSVFCLRLPDLLRQALSNHRWGSTCPMASWSVSARQEAARLPARPRLENGF